MKIVVDIGHPAHVHYFKNFIWEMENRGHEILITAINKEISYHLLDNYGFDYIKLGGHRTKLYQKILNIPIMDFKMYSSVKNFKPDIFLGFGSIRAAHVSKMLGKPSVTFEDTELSPVELHLYMHFTDAILTPNCFTKDLGKKQAFFNGYIELAHLHPNYFKPNPQILESFGENTHSKYVLLRFVAWKAVHDIGKRGFDLESKIKIVKALEKKANIYISSELPLPPELDQYRIKISPEHIHDVLYYAHMLIGDSQTMSTEAALLGTPAIRCNSFVGKDDMGNFMELEKKYGLIYNFNDPDKAIGKAIKLICEDKLKEQWQNKRKKLLEDKIDVTSFMVDFIENYPESYIALKRKKIQTGSNR